VLGAAVQFEAVDTLALEHQFKNLRHGFLLEDAPVRTQPGTCQLRFDHSVVARARKAGFALAEGADQAMYVSHRPVDGIKGEQRRLVEQVAEVDIVFVADKFQVQHKWLAEGLLQLE